jgi:2',3'-cyclic-nucleotide 2'-phosphodiesterase (5'-nucleotidase family)
LATVIDSLRSDYPDLILLHSGDFFTTYPLPGYNSFMMEFMQDLSHNAIGIGYQEFMERISFHKYINRNASLPLICSNLVIPDSLKSIIQSQSIIASQGFSAGVFSVNDPGVFDFIHLQNLKVTPLEQAIRLGINNLKDKVDFAMLICPVSYQTASQLGKIFPEISIIIAGYTQEQYESVGNGQMIVQSGYNGENIGILMFHLSHGQLYIEHRFIPVNSHYADYIPFKQKINVLKMKQPQ